MAPKKKVDEDAESPTAKKAKAAGPTSGAKAAANGSDSIERSATPRPPKEAGLVVAHWNIAGLNGLMKSEERKERLLALLKEEEPDIIALSEHKLSEAKATAGASELMALCPAYKAHWAICTAKNGYSGIGVLVKRELKVLSVKLDEVCNIKEGRTVTLELEDLHVVATYVPNSGQDLKRLDFRIDTWDPALRAHLAALQQSKPVCLIGDLNVAHLDADIWNVRRSCPQRRGCPQHRITAATRPTRSGAVARMRCPARGAASRAGDSLDRRVADVPATPAAHHR